MKRKRTGTTTAGRGPQRKKAKKGEHPTSALVIPPKWEDELKYTYYAQTTTADYTGTLTSVFVNVARGDGAKDAFDGAILHPKSITLNGQAVLADTTNMVRIVVAQAIRGALPTAITLFQSVTNVRAPLTTFDRGTKTQVNILSDTLLQLDASHIARTFRVYIPGRKLVDVYWTTTGALSLVGGDIGVYYISDSSAVTHPTLQYAVETTYTD